MDDFGNVIDCAADGLTARAVWLADGLPGMFGDAFLRMIGAI